MTTAELDPGSICLFPELASTYGSPDESATAVLCQGARNILGRELWHSLLEPSMNEDGLVSRLQGRLEADIDSIIPNELQKERERCPNGPILHNALGVEVPERERMYGPSQYWQGPVQQYMPTEFARVLVGEVASGDFEFATLLKMREAFAGSPLFGIAQRLNNLSLYKEGGPTDAVDQAYDLVRHSFNASHTLPEGQEDAMYFLCFLPRPVRRLITKAVWANQMIHHMQGQLGEDLSDSEAEMVSAIESALSSESLVDDAWYELVNTQGASERVAKDMAIVSAERISSLAKIQEIYRRGGAERVIDAYGNAQQYLGDHITEAMRRSNLWLLANTDIGHGFNGFHDEELEGMIGQCFYTRELNTPPKTGGRAVVFEKDPELAARWAEFINDHTAYITADASHVPVTLEDIEKVSGDPEVGLFLIDIASEDGAAEIALAERILREQRALDRSGRKSVSTEIRLWSGSPDKVRRASQHFEALLISDREVFEGSDSRYAINIALERGQYNSSCRTNKVGIRTRGKYWKEYDIPLVSSD